MTTPNESPAAPLLTSVLDQLGGEIVAGTLSEGRTFTLQDISARFGISRTVAREAMRALEQLGLVASSRRVGITVLPETSWAVFDQSVIRWRLAAEEQRPRQLRSLTELRVAIEPIAAYNAATFATKEQKAKIAQLADELIELGSSSRGATDEFLEADMQFHTMIFLASGNEMIMDLAPSLMYALEGRTRYGLQPDEPAQEALASHKAVAQAIVDGDAQAAENAARDILSEVRTALYEN
ncbi:FCD domain-containing protein [Corynebacterium breve]|uniref:FCD domain-containing protein n=1 Tax=Corynebacterium breve TaxID=3049799 RepID=A0ABY8VE84_9CORY|nr:FCD domain-containing protein [Corynebacterium breve]WIM67266.1 FCD domain-containing protein [Corynebacterium breve]